MKDKLIIAKQKELIDLLSRYFGTDEVFLSEIQEKKKLESELSELESKEETCNNPIACDTCGRHPAVVVINEFGTFCKEHAKYIKK
jgi:hypothetical protein